MKMKNNPIMVFDVESIGLHGEGFAVGYVVIHHGEEVERGCFACDPKKAMGYASNLQWVMENIPLIKPNQPTPEYVREKFWERWQYWKKKNAVLAADCGWPVETNFLSKCVDWDELERQFDGPYPLVEISTVLTCAGMDPLGTFDRLENELPKHDPLCDARQSSRLLIEALNTLRQ